MQLLDNARDIVTKSWSMRLIAVATAAEWAISYIPMAADVPRWLIIALLVLAAGARVVAQEGLSLPEGEDL